MRIARLIVAALPQILLLLALGGALDLLGGWNHTDGATGVLLGLFVLSPAVTLGLLLTEAVGAFRRWRRSGSKAPFRPGLAALLFVEALALDLGLLSQMHMH